MNTIIIIAILIFAAVAGALGRRMAGGLLSQWLGTDLGDQPARALQACLIGLVVLAAGASGWEPVLVIPAVFAGATVGMFGVMIPVTIKDLALLLAYGLLAVAPVAGLAWAGGYLWWPVLAAGAFRPFAYLYARFFPMGWPLLGCLRRDPPPTAELLSGAAFGLAVAASILAAHL